MESATTTQHPGRGGTLEPAHVPEALRVPHRAGERSIAAILRDRGPGDGRPNLSFLRLQWEALEQPVPVTGSVRLELEVLPKLW